MSNFHFWASLITAVFLGLLGFVLGGLLPLPAPYETYSRFIYAVIGILIGLVTFASMSSWIVKNVTRLTKQLVIRLAYEIFDQFNRTNHKRLRSEVMSLSEIRKNTSATTIKKNFAGSIIILDTSSIIDGRILGVAKTGFLSGLILLPGFVLTELRLVADSNDPIKRTRGKKGFEVIDSLKKISGIKLVVWEKEISGKEVDDKLIKLGRMIGGRILTCDFNLNRAATLSGVTVLNLNELANSLKTLPLPGEKLTIKLIHPGKDKNQGVGYCIDGAMVVVKDASLFIGKEVEVEVTKILQGPSGRMIFGKKI